MDSELKTIITSLKSKIGIDIDVYAETKKFFVSTRNNFELVPPSKSEFEEVYCDEMNGKTYFKITFKNAKLICVIDGYSETEKNYAYLIGNYIENSFNKDAGLSRSEYLKSIILGDTNRSQIQKFMRKFNVPDLHCYVLVIISPSGRTREVLNLLTNYENNGLDTPLLMDDMSIAYIKFIDNENDNDYQSASDFSQILEQTILEETGLAVKIGVSGTAKHLLDINVSYQQAATAMRMCTIFNSKGGVHSYKEFILVKMLEDIPQFKLNEYLDILLDSEAQQIYSDSEMITTAEEFLDNSLNVSETSRNLFMHRNTLMYRLDKIEKMTGLNIRNFTDAVTFRLITILYKLIK